MGATATFARTDYTSRDLRGLAGKCADGEQVLGMPALALVLGFHWRGEAAGLNRVNRQTLCHWLHRYTCGRYRAAAWFAVTLTVVSGTCHAEAPAGPIHPPLISWTGSRRSLDSREGVLQAGQVYYEGWEFRDSMRLVDGVWHFSVAIQGKIVLEQDFTVHTACGRPIS